MKTKKLLTKAIDVASHYPDVIFDESSLFKEKAKVKIILKILTF